jgi:hypothetical protein
MKLICFFFRERCAADWSAVGKDSDASVAARGNSISGGSGSQGAVLRRFTGGNEGEPIADQSYCSISVVVTKNWYVSFVFSL